MEKVDSFVVFVTYRTATPELINFLMATFDWFINLFPIWQVPLRSINASFILLEHLIWWLIGFDQLTEKLLRKLASVRKWVIWIEKRENSWRAINIIYKVHSISDSFMVWNGQICYRGNAVIQCGRVISGTPWAWVFLWYLGGSRMNMFFRIYWKKMIKARWTRETESRNCFIVLDAAI